MNNLDRVCFLILITALLIISSVVCNLPSMPMPTKLPEDQFVLTLASPALETGSPKNTTDRESTEPPPSPSPEPIFNTATYEPAFTPLPSVRFAIIGDFGLAGQPLADVAALIYSWDVDLIITTGDNNYPDGAAATIDENIGQYFHEYIYPYTGAYGQGADTNRFFPTLGNHDWTASGAQPHLDYFTLPGNERYYDFVWGPVHFFAIDSDSREPDGVGRSSVQGQWLQTKLAESKAVWKVVYMHQPPFSSSHDGSIDWAQWPYQEWGASIVLAGHSHVYERLEVGGLPYIVNGLGGGPIYAFNDPLPGSLVRYNADYGAMLAEATTEAITFQFITRYGEVIDFYTVTVGD